MRSLSYLWFHLNNNNNNNNNICCLLLLIPFDRGFLMTSYQ